VAFSRFLGYDRGEDGNLVVNPEQAVTVKLIYKLFLSGLSYTAVAKELTSRKIKTPAGKDKWCPGTVQSILTSEKMKGDALLQKKFTADFLTKKLVKNEGQIPQYYVTANHEAIIDPATFDLVQAEIERRRGGGRYSGVTIFSNRRQIYTTLQHLGSLPNLFNQLDQCVHKTVGFSHGFGLCA